MVGISREPLRDVRVTCPKKAPKATAREPRSGGRAVLGRRGRQLAIKADEVRQFQPVFGLLFVLEADGFRVVPSIGHQRLGKGEIPTAFAALGVEVLSQAHSLDGPVDGHRVFYGAG